MTAMITLKSLFNKDDDKVVETTESNVVPIQNPNDIQSGETYHHWGKRICGNVNGNVMALVPFLQNVYNYIYRKYTGISFETCTDEDGGYNPINTTSNSWISFYIENDKEQFRKIRIRYTADLYGFGIQFKKYDEYLGELTNLERHKKQLAMELKQYRERIAYKEK